MSERDRPSWLPAELYPFESRYLCVEDACVHYVDEGSGPTLLLLHGNPTWSFLYREIIKALRSEFSCVAIDYPGFGLSTPPPGYRFMPAEHAHIVETFVQQLDLSAVTTMVQDWGGPIGFALALRHPDRFSRFVIGNTWAWPKSDPGSQVFSRVLGGALGGYLIQRHNIFVERILPFGLPALRERPVLLCWATNDFAFRERELKYWETTFPNHRRVLLEGAGHYIQEDAAPDIAAAIRAFA